MTLNGWIQIAAFFLVLLVLVKPLGLYMARVYLGYPHPLLTSLGPLERVLYRLCGIRPDREMEWTTYAFAILLFSGIGMAFAYSLQRLQALLPLNPRHLGSVPPALAFNTAASYVTNTNWQAYSGEATMSHLIQMLALTSQDFISSAIGVAMLLALARSLAHGNIQTIGNLWVDLVRTVLYVLLPLAFVSSLVLVSQGAVQTLDGWKNEIFLQSMPVAHDDDHARGGPVSEGEQPGEGQTSTQKAIPVGPVATQVIARDLGTSGGGFFNANSAHPFESPTPLSDFLLLLLQTMIAAALTYTYGRIVGDTRQGWMLLAVMLVVLAMFVGIAYRAESVGNAAFAPLGADLSAMDQQPGGHMEGKEVRFGIARTALVAAATTATSTGAANGMHDSLTPIGGLVTLVLMQLGEVILGGVGSGLTGMLVLVILAAFIGGLMIGRTPEYLGKKLEPFDIKMVALAILTMPVVVLLFTALALATDVGRESIFNQGPHGLSEVLYAYTSMANNNGSTFGGLNANTLFYNVTGALAMLVGRLWIVIPTLALAGSLARKRMVHVGEGTLPTHTPLFALWLMIVTFALGAMTFLPALALGPIVEQLMMSGRP